MLQWQQSEHGGDLGSKLWRVCEDRGSEGRGFEKKKGRKLQTVIEAQLLTHSFFTTEYTNIISLSHSCLWTLQLYFFTCCRGDMATAQTVKRLWFMKTFPLTAPMSVKVVSALLWSNHVHLTHSLTQKVEQVERLWNTDHREEKIQKKPCHSTHLR